MRHGSADSPLVGMGCMRLSTEPDRDEDGAVAVLHAALDAGVTLLDTADAYCLDARETGHNERLIARALTSWSGDRSRVTIATKGGLTRPDGRWAADGRARHLAAACEASCRALGLARLPLYQLHAPDPRTPLATSVRALDALKRNGLIEAIGLCNVTVSQIEDARRLADISSVQVEVSLWQHDALLGGVVAHCLAHGLLLLAYRPLGGAKRRPKVGADPLLVEIAGRHGATPFEIALAWLAQLSDRIVPLPGATRVETARSSGGIRRIALTGDDLARLEARVPAVARLTRPAAAAPAPIRPARADAEVVLVMGLPAAGKSTVAQELVGRGYQRLNRDAAGGSLAGLLPDLDRLLRSGVPRLVLDNTYLTRASRAAVIDVARRHGTPVRCLWLTTSVEDAQVNAVERLIARYGKLPMPEEITALSRRDPAVFGPSAQFRAGRSLEEPQLSEGFAGVELLPFSRAPRPDFTGRAVIVWCDGVLSGEATYLDDRRARLRRCHEEGWRILGLSWRPEAAGSRNTGAAVDADLAALAARLGVPIEIAYCPHGAGPPVCWCRKPLPGLGVAFIHRHRLDAARCLYVGAGPQDPGFARRLGFAYRPAGEFFTDSGKS